MTRSRDTTPRLALTTPTGPDLQALENIAPPWMDHAACGPDTADLFFPNSVAYEASVDAIAICKTCPVWRDCLSHSNQIETRTTTIGVWGGMSESNRRRVRRGRPPTFYVRPKNHVPASEDSETEVQTEVRRPTGRCGDCDTPVAENRWYCDPCRDARRVATKTNSYALTKARRKSAS